MTRPVGQAKTRPTFFLMLLGSCTAQVGIWTDMRARPRGIGNDDLWRCTAKDRGEQQRQYRQMQLGLSETMRRESAERLVRHKTQTQDPVYRPPFQPPQQTQPEAAANNKSLDLFAATMGSVREIMMSALVGMDQAGGLWGMCLPMRCMYICC